MANTNLVRHRLVGLRRRMLSWSLDSLLGQSSSEGLLISGCVACRKVHDRWLRQHGECTVEQLKPLWYIESR